jgi:nucleotide-binding universal stress UspA family protein
MTRDGDRLDRRGNLARLRRRRPNLRTPGEGIILLHVSGHDILGIARGSYAGLPGRSDPGRDPGTRMEDLAAVNAAELLDAAARRLGRRCTRLERSGRIEREVVTAAEGADLLVLASDGDRGRLGPESLGAATRFVVDHDPWPVLLVWPGPASGIGAIPPPPSRPPHRR